LGAHIGLTTAIGRGVLLTGLVLSCLFSAMLVRQAVERRGFVERVRYLEKELRSSCPVFAIEIPRGLGLITSLVFAWLLFAESAVTVIIVAAYACCRCVGV